MNKKAFIPVALSLIALASASVFLDSQKVGNFVSPVSTSMYAVLSFIILAGVALFVIFKR